MKKLLGEFRDFVMRGNVIDLAVAVVVGAAFTAVVTSFANDVLMQVVSAVFGKQDFSDIVWTLNDAEIRIGTFITALVNFVIIAVVVFFVVKGINTLMALRRREVEEGEAEPTELDVLTEIRDLLRNRTP